MGDLNQTSQSKKKASDFRLPAIVGAPPLPSLSTIPEPKADDNNTQAERKKARTAINEAPYMHIPFFLMLDQLIARRGRTLDN